VSESAAPSTLRLVLLRPRVPENLGAVARAMKNFGLSDWVVVAPEANDEAAARRLAVQSEDRLAARKSANSLDEAVAGCAWVVGTSSRRPRGARRYSPREFAEEAVARAAPVALVFGDERSGLTNEEIERCHALSSVPADESQPSLNLAQAVLLYAWEYRQAVLAREERPRGALPIAADDAELERLGALLRSVLKTSGFLQEEERHAIRDLLAPLRRSRLTRTEARLWTAALASVRKRG
jgi:TrmH family RNA methyltransferase